MEWTDRAYKRWTPVAVAALVSCLTGAASAHAQAGPFKVGDRVECDTIGNKNGYRKATVIPYVEGDAANGHDQYSGYFYRIQIDGWNAEGMLCWTEDLRALVPRVPAAAAPRAAPAPQAGLAATANGNTGGRPLASTPAVGTVPADRPILQCPIVQPPARNGDAPNLELIKKVFRCQYGEKPARPGLDGAVTIDVDAIQVGQSRKWVFAGGTGGQDGDGGTADTIVFPIKITFTHKTHYRSGTTISSGTIRIYRFYVNGFGEWQYGSAENVRDGVIQDIKNN
jgi:hypothetical protein